MADDVKVVVQGIPELSRALRQIDAGLPKELKKGFTKIAEVVATSTRARMPKRSGRAAASVKARASTRGGKIAAYGTAAPYGPWLDFGGSTGRGHRPGQAWSGAIKRPWRGVPSGEGRFIYPAIRDNSIRIIHDTEELVDGLARKAGFETRKGVG